MVTKLNQGFHSLQRVFSVVPSIFFSFLFKLFSEFFYMNSLSFSSYFNSINKKKKLIFSFQILNLYALIFIFLLKICFNYMFLVSLCQILIIFQFKSHKQVILHLDLSELLAILCSSHLHNIGFIYFSIQTAFRILKAISYIILCIHSSFF